MESMAKGMAYTASQNYALNTPTKEKVSNSMLMALDNVAERVDGINKKLSIFSERMGDVCDYIYGSSPTEGKEMTPPSPGDRIPDGFVERARIHTSAIQTKLDNLENILLEIERYYERLREFI
jgi:hypothetical protein